MTKTTSRTKAVALAVVATFGCTSPAPLPAPSPPQPPAVAPPAAAPSPSPAAAAGRVELDPAGVDLFRAHGVDGAFVLLDLATDDLYVANPAQADVPYTPASTFKIPNTLIGLETGAIPDASFALKWDGKPRDVPEWNRNHDLASAMKYSVVWYYQEVARRIGEERMKRHVDAFDYGNRDISGGVDRFWLDGGLRITARQQIAFLKKVFTGTLPVRAENIEILKRLIVLEQADGYTLRGKTGMGADDTQTVGWLVGGVEAKGKRLVYATLLVDKPGEITKMRPLRLELTKEFLKRRGLTR